MLWHDESCARTRGYTSRWEASDNEDQFLCNTPYFDGSCARTRPFQKTPNDCMLLQVDGTCDLNDERILRSKSAKEKKTISLVIKMSPGRGRGLFAGQNIEKGTIVCEYEGNLIGEKDIPEKLSSSFPPKIEEWSHGCDNFAFFFQTLDGKTWCVDAEGTISYGASINHSRKNFNLVPFVCEKEKGRPRLFFKAARSISKNEELFYDYGERDEAALAAHPWLRE